MCKDSSKNGLNPARTVCWSKLIINQELAYFKMFDNFTRNEDIARKSLSNPDVTEVVEK